MKKTRKNKLSKSAKSQQNKPSATIGKKYKINLRSFEDVRRLLSSTINELRRGEISESKAKAVGYLTNCIMTSLENIVLEDELRKLETAMEERNEGY